MVEYQSGSSDMTQSIEANVMVKAVDHDAGWLRSLAAIEVAAIGLLVLLMWSAEQPGHAEPEGEVNDRPNEEER